MQGRIIVIDCLRICSAGAVFLFHFGLFDYGYLGVDLFFFLSGFILTLTSYQHRNATGFLFRRLKRIIVPLLFTIILTLGVFGLVASEQNFEAMLATSTSALVGLSNVQLYLNYDYFSDYDIPNPLIHFWSISAEVWFYVIFWFFWKINLWHKNLPLVSVLAIGLYLTTKFGFSHSNSIYLIGVDRFFEFSIGGLVCRSLFISPKSKSKMVVALIGLGIVVTGLLFGENHLPLVLTGMLATLLLAVQGLLKYRVHSGVLAHAANCTYEFYLVHLPLKVLLIDYLLFQPSMVFVSLIFGFSCLLSHFVYVCADPACRLNFLSNFRVRMAQSYPAGLLALVVLQIFLSQPSDQINNGEGTLFAGQECEDDLAFCGTKKTLPNGFLYGDSNARQVVDTLLTSGYSVSHRSSHCIFSFCMRDPASEFDKRWNDSHLMEMASEPRRAVVVGYQWAKFLEGSFYFNNNKISVDQKTFATWLASDIVEFANQRTGKVIVYGSFSGTHFAMKWTECVKLHGFEKCASSPDKYAEFNRVLEETFKESKVIFFNPSVFLCDEKGQCLNSYNGRGIYRDSGHLSQNGMDLILKRFTPFRVN